VYFSRFPSTPDLEAYLRNGRITGPGETARDMINRIVGTLAAADARLDPCGADAFAQRLGEALDDRLIVFSTPVMTNAGRHASRPLAACAVPPADLRGDLTQVKAIVDDYHREPPPMELAKAVRDAIVYAGDIACECGPVRVHGDEAVNEPGVHDALNDLAALSLVTMTVEH